jgi:hypothetical protein
MPTSKDPLVKAKITAYENATKRRREAQKAVERLSNQPNSRNYERAVRNLRNAIDAEDRAGTSLEVLRRALSRK